MKRQLSLAEKTFSLKNVEGMKEESEYNKYQLEICDLKLKSGLEIDYKKGIRDYKTLKREFEDKLKILKEKINITQDQIRNGVEQKKDIELVGKKDQLNIKKEE